MAIPLSQCIIKLHEEQHDLEDYQGGVPRWCSGCGDNAILAAVQRLCRDENLAPERTVFVSGIGCSSRFPHYMKTYGFHGIHGRAFPIAEGVKFARPDLHVFVNTGDGDCCSIGAAHWIHALRYNMNLTVILHDNHVYGLTKKQASPTSPVGFKSNTTPRGSVLLPLNPLTVTLGVENVSFVAQAVDWMPGAHVRHRLEGVPPPRVLVHPRDPALPRVPAQDVRALAARSEQDAAPHARERPAAERGHGPHLQEPARARPAGHPPRPRDRLQRGPDPGRHPLPEPGSALLRGPARGRQAAHGGGECARGWTQSSTSSRSGPASRASNAPPRRPHATTTAEAGFRWTWQPNSRTSWSST